MYLRNSTRLPISTRVLTCFGYRSLLSLALRHHKVSSTLLPSTEKRSPHLPGLLSLFRRPLFAPILYILYVEDTVCMRSMLKVVIWGHLTFCISAPRKSSAAALVLSSTLISSKSSAWRETAWRSFIHGNTTVRNDNQLDYRVRILHCFYNFPKINGYLFYFLPNLSTRTIILFPSARKNKRFSTVLHHRLCSVSVSSLKFEYLRSQAVFTMFQLWQCPIRRRTATKKRRVAEVFTKQYNGYDLF